MLINLIITQSVKVNKTQLLYSEDYPHPHLETVLVAALSPLLVLLFLLTNL